jgi:hypothetical protein
MARRPDSRILRGYREIAVYARLRRDTDSPQKGVSTVRAWVAHRGLPVMVLGAGRGRAALISTAVFDAWLALQSPVFKKWKRGPARKARQLWLPLT